MADLNAFLKIAGNWQGKNTMWLSPGDPARESDSTLAISPAMKGIFAEIKYTWADEGKSQEGVLLVGYETKRELATAVWADSWHMQEKTMNLQGTLNEGGTLDLRGAYQSPTGPDWGWRIVLQPEDESNLNLTMFNILPDGTEFLAVKTTYSRSIIK